VRFQFRRGRATAVWESLLCTAQFVLQLTLPVASVLHVSDSMSATAGNCVTTPNCSFTPPGGQHSNLQKCRPGYRYPCASTRIWKPLPEHSSGNGLPRREIPTSEGADWIKLAPEVLLWGRFFLTRWWVWGYNKSWTFYPCLFFLFWGRQFRSEWSWIYSASNRNEYQEHSWWERRAGA
jgi:hypothetical protein